MVAASTAARAALAIILGTACAKGQASAPDAGDAGPRRLIGPDGGPATPLHLASDLSAVYYQQGGSMALIPLSGASSPRSLGPAPDVIYESSSADAAWILRDVPSVPA